MQDIDTWNLFADNDAGIAMAATRELQEEHDGLSALTLAPVGVIDDLTSPEGTKHVGVVLSAELPPDFTLERSRRERAVNDLRLASVSEVVERVHEFEFWSQLVIRHVLASPDSVGRATIWPDKVPTRTAGICAIAGEIASGKTTVADLLERACGFRRVSTRGVIAELIGATDFGTRPRGDFQDRAQRLVSSADGIARLVAAIELTVRAGPHPVVIDGIRHVDTLRGLRDRIPGLLCVFIDAPRDTALLHFVARSGFAATATEFRSARFHEVEAEIGLLKREADVYVFNGGTMQQLEKAIIGWSATTFIA